MILDERDSESALGVSRFIPIMDKVHIEVVGG
jgi:hypothetical protein